MKIISVTGTKGKTTIVRALDYVIRNLGIKTLRVDTDGHYINGKQKSTGQDSLDIFKRRPTVCPGKYLMDMKRFFPKFAGIFECSIGCSGKQGRGYSRHNIGIFSNVFEDHIGTGKNKTRLNLAESKNFIFKAIDEDGTAVFNADDYYVCSQLKRLPKKRRVKTLPVGIDFKHFAIKRHLKEGGKVITLEGDYVVQKTKDKTIKIANLHDFHWTFKGKYKPSTYNLMLILGTLKIYLKPEKLERAIQILKEYRFDKHGGRLIKLHTKRGAEIIVDYAHEKYSLLEIAELANKLKERKSIGIIRLAPNRPDALIRNTGRALANKFDHLIIYDKVDGITKGPEKKGKYFRQVGETSQILYKAAKSKQKENIERIISEEDAIKKAAEIAKKGDVVVFISNEDHKKSLKLVQRHFRARVA